jgi:hypothetical protein
MKIQVVISAVQGIIDEVATFSTEKKALAKINGWVEPDLKTVEDFRKWQESEVGQDCRDDILWFETDLD